MRAPPGATGIVPYISRFSETDVFTDAGKAIGIAKRQFVVGEDRFFHVFFSPLLDRRSLAGDLHLKERLLRAGSAYLTVSLEGEFMRIVPDDYYDFWSWTNGASLFGGHLRLLGLIDDKGFNGAGEISGPGSMALANSEHLEITGNRCLIFGSYGFDGSLLVFMNGSPSVARIDRVTKAILNSWDSFWIFLSNEFERMDGLFDNAYVARDMNTVPISL